MVVCLVRGGVSAWSGGCPCQGGSPGWGGLPSPGGCLPAGVVSVLGGVCLVSGVCLVRGFLLPGGSPCLTGGMWVSAWSGGVLPPGGGVPPSWWGGSSLLPRGGSPCLETPPVNRITDTCKNITLATTSLRPVMIFLIPRRCVDMSAFNAF